MSPPYSRIRIGPDPADSGTQLDVLEDDGAKFPAPPFVALVWPTQHLPNSENSEELTVTSVIGDTLFVCSRVSPIEIEAGMQIAVLRAVPTLRLGETITLQVAYSVYAPPYTLWVTSSQGATASYGGSAGVDSCGDPVAFHDLVADIGGIWYYRWETGPEMSAGPDGSFFVEHTAAR